LSNFNPQDGESPVLHYTSKQFRATNITYAKIVNPNSNLTLSQASLFTLTDIDKLYEAMSAQFGDQFGTKISINNLEKE
jgi:hypothetical protein